MTNSLRVLPLSALCLCGVWFQPEMVHAQDQLRLSNGTIIPGTKVSEDANAALVDLKFDNGIEVVLPRSNFKAATEATDKLKNYQSKSKVLKDSVKDQEASVNYLKGSSLDDLALAHFQRIVELDPSNSTAWRSLKYSEGGDGWIPDERYWKSKGMIFDAGKWRTPQDVAITRIADERKVAASKMKGDIDKNLREINSGGKAGQRATAFFSELREAIALPHLTEKILDEETDEATRLFLLDVVMRLNAKSLSTAVVKIMISDDSIQVRDKCLDYLDAHPSDAALQQLVQYLTNKDPKKDNAETYNRAAAGIELIGDDRCIPKLIDVLVSNHQRESGPNTQQNIGFNSNGGIAMAQGNQKRVEKWESRNSGVLSALNSITKADLGYDKDGWKEWYARYMADTGLSLRRDDL